MQKKIGFSSDSNVYGWWVGFKSKSKFFGTIIAEKDAFTIVMRLTDDQIKKAYEEVLPYAQGVLIVIIEQAMEAGFNTQLDDAKKILKIRNK